MAKRVTLFAGHYGSGKTNVAVNFALNLAKTGIACAVCDLDIVNPYFRTKDSAKEFEEAGIRLISSAYANSNVDIPALPQDMYAVTDDLQTHFIVDVGGDDRGALALGRLSPAILAEHNFELFLVVNFYRPLTATVEEAIEVMREMELAGGLPFTAIINNSNVGEETTIEHVYATQSLAEALSCATGLPLKMTTHREGLLLSPDLVTNPTPLSLQKKYY